MRCWWWFGVWDLRWQKVTNDAPAEPPSPWPPLPTLIKSSFYSDKHSHVIYIETMPRPGLWGEININYSNPLPPPPLWGFGNILIWWFETSSPAQPVPLVKTSCLPFVNVCRPGLWTVLTVDTGKYLEREERPPPCVNMLHCCTALDCTILIITPTTHHTTHQTTYCPGNCLLWAGRTWACDAMIFNYNLRELITLITKFHCNKGIRRKGRGRLRKVNSHRNWLSVGQVWSALSKLIV